MGNCAVIMGIILIMRLLVMNVIITYFASQIGAVGRKTTDLIMCNGARNTLTFGEWGVVCKIYTISPKNAIYNKKSLCYND